MAAGVFQKRAPPVSHPHILSQCDPVTVVRATPRDFQGQLIKGDCFHHHGSSMGHTPWLPKLLATLELPCWRGHVERPQRARERCQGVLDVQAHRPVTKHVRQKVVRYPRTSLGLTQLRPTGVETQLSPLSLPTLQMCEQNQCHLDPPGGLE